MYQSEKQLKELGDKVPADVKTKVEEKMEATREALKGEDLAKVKVSVYSPHIHRMPTVPLVVFVDCLFVHVMLVSLGVSKPMGSFAMATS